MISRGGRANPRTSDLRRTVWLSRALHSRLEGTTFTRIGFSELLSRLEATTRSNGVLIKDQKSDRAHSPSIIA